MFVSKMKYAIAIFASFCLCYQFYFGFARTITCEGPTSKNICSNPLHHCGGGLHGWCANNYDHHCCCKEPQPSTETCTEPIRCHFVCCSWPQTPCGYDCCNPSNSTIDAIQPGSSKVKKFRAKSFCLNDRKHYEKVTRGLLR